MRFPRLPMLDIDKLCRLVTCCGDRHKPVYTGSYRADGTIVLSKIDEIDVQDDINSHLHDCDMSIILSKLLAGDVSAIRQRLPMYGDFTQFPTSYVEMLDLVTKGADVFDALPADVRVKFDNDRSKWFASIGTDAWCDAMGYAPASPDNVDTPPAAPAEGGQS